VAGRLQPLCRSFESAHPPPTAATLAAFVGRLILFQSGDGGMNHCRPKIRTGSSQHESLSRYLLFSMLPSSLRIRFRSGPDSLLTWQGGTNQPISFSTASPIAKLEAYESY
jgi:hypothetical protein